jgi:hypothetical protein
MDFINLQMVGRDLIQGLIQQAASRGGSPREKLRMIAKAG